MTHNNLQAKAYFFKLLISIIVNNSDGRASTASSLHWSALCSIHNTYIQYIYTHTASAKQKRPVAGGWPKTKSPKNDQNSIVLPSAPLLIRSIDKKEHKGTKKK